MKAMNQKGLRVLGRSLLATWAFFAFPTLAFAAEEGEQGGMSAIMPDMLEFIPMLVAFIILWIVLAKLDRKSVV